MYEKCYTFEKAMILKFVKDKLEKELLNIFLQYCQILIFLKFAKINTFI